MQPQHLTERVQATASGANRPSIFSLRFTVRAVTSVEDLPRVQALRAVAYGHHLPHLASEFGKADPLDLHPDVVIFVAEDKATGQVVGSCRIQVNETGPLQIHSCMEPPAHHAGKLVSEITRMVVAPTYGDPLVRMALVKTSHLFCIGRQISGIYAGSRTALLRQYRSLGFSYLFSDKREIPLSYASGIPHHILWLDSVTAEFDWRNSRNLKYDFVFTTYTPDIHVFSGVRGIDTLRKQSAKLTNKVPNLTASLEHEVAN